MEYVAAGLLNDFEFGLPSAGILLDVLLQLRAISLIREDHAAFGHIFRARKVSAEYRVLESLNPNAGYHAR